jgi:putative ABC transport system substrate-binding protein
MRRREFITLIGGAAAALPLAARAQHSERIRRIGVLMNLASGDPEAQVRIAAFVQGLQQFGWSVGRNVRIDYRWYADDADSQQRYAAELVALEPAAILASGGRTVVALQHATRRGPIVFAQVIDPVGAGYVASLARPGGNTTGFTLFEYGMSGKWLELLKQIAPRITRVAVIREPTAIGIGQWSAIQAVAPSFAVELTPVDPRDASEIERSIPSFARGSDGGLILAAGAFAALHRELIFTLAARHRLPAVYPYRFHVAGGGLISYGPDTVDPYR